MASLSSSAASSRKGIIHRDLKACNVFVLSDGFRLLDVEDILFAAPTEETMRRMLVQLNTSVPERISVADRVRFFVNLVSGFSLDRKRLLREVARLSRNEDIVYEGVSGLKKGIMARPSTRLPSAFFHFPWTLKNPLLRAGSAVHSIEMPFSLSHPGWRTCYR